MTKVLGINGSPRDDSTTKELLYLTLEAASMEGANIEELKLVEYPLPTCKGCVSYYGTCNLEECIKYGDENTAFVLRKLIDSDVIIFATPVYWFGPSGLMKNLIDRMTSLEHKQKILDGRVGGIICSYEEEGASMAISQLFLALSDMGLLFPPYAYTYNRGKEIDEMTRHYAVQLGINAVKLFNTINGTKWWKG